ncbi:MAG: malonic semialdehyde reductase [Alphaproteobacteria bacterium]|nr:malonic semialdehyde reductase [Alphaproteobacteria bacterium]
MQVGFKAPLDKNAQAQLFTEARTVNVWTDKAVSDEQLQALYDLLKMGATSANCCPARFVFVKTAEAKERLKPHLMEGNQAKVMQAPVTVIIATDTAFAEKLPELFPHEPDAKNWFSDPAVSEETAFRNGTLQGAYLMLAARTLGLDCGPMSGFDKDAVDKEFFAETTLKANFICSLGYGSEERIFPRSPRLAFDDAAQIL